MPFFDFALELASALDTVDCKLNVNIRPFVSVENQPGSIIVDMLYDKSGETIH